MKDQNEYTWDELLEHNTRNIHNGLLEGGGKGMRSAVYMSMVHTLEWAKEQEKKIAGKESVYTQEDQSVIVIERAIREWANGSEFIETAQADTLANHILNTLNSYKALKG